MGATREQLEGRWDTEEGGWLAREISDILGSDEGTLEMLLQWVSRLPFIGEVAPEIDLRGLHLPPEALKESEYIFINSIDLPGVRFDYLRNVVKIISSRLEWAAFDEMEAIGSIFYKNDFRNASFERASLKGVKFDYSDVSGASFRKACLAAAEFGWATCRGTSFVGADMRFAYCPEADFRGADFTGIDMTEAILGSIQFNEKTRLQGTILYGASMNDAFRAFARQAGAFVNTQEEDDERRFPVHELAYVDGLIKIVQEKGFNTDGHLDAVLPYVVAQREKLAQELGYDWSTPLMGELMDAFSDDIAREVLYLYEVVMKNFAYYV